jgi:hypothetical protein
LLWENRLIPLSLELVFLDSKEKGSTQTVGD